VTERVSVLGIRHHGPGSARSVLRALTRLEPDLVLIEGPPDAQPVLHLAAAPGMRPPVALVVFPPEQPGIGSFYPFAVFSPEWNALRFALEREIPVRFCDLPQAIQLADPRRGKEEEEHGDPIRTLAEAAGENDPERWWERLVEQRADDTDVFRAVGDAMAAVRETLPPPQPREARREAYMRQAIRQARREGFLKIAVVCGAWHAPALESMPTAKADADVLRGLKRLKVEATWVPWTASRLTFESGYGAGVESPAWYRHVWETNGDLTRWLSSAARLLREQDLDASPAQVVESVRLAEALAALRNRPQPSLSEVSDATLAVLCAGDMARLALVRDKLIVGEEMGALPDEVPAIPLQRDLESEARRLRLRFEPDERQLDLDLRQSAHLERSQLLHRLRLLGIDWGRPDDTPRGQLGTFHEFWWLRWRPELALQVIEAGVYGNTLAAAASARAVERGQRIGDLGQLATLVQVVLLANLGEAVPAIVDLLGARSAATSDVAEMLRAVSPLASTLRYGDVRQTDTSAIARVVWALAERSIVGLAPACIGLDDEAAQTFARDLAAASRALASLENASLLDDWWAALGRLVERDGVPGLVAGTCSRLLLSAERTTHEQVADRLARALARGAEPAAAAGWLEGFLSSSGLVLATSSRLFQIVDDWLSDLPDEYFSSVLPLLRRTTSTFSTGERRQIAERVRHGHAAQALGSDELDPERAALVEPILRRLLGLDA
jgi:Family of unknown function (DUF5682)